MAYLKTILVPNEDIFTPIDYYTCDITGNIICEADGWFGNDKIHICEEGIEILLEQWITRLSNGFLAPIALKYLEDRFTDRIKPDRYISLKTRKFVLAKYKHKCALCPNTEKLEIDHIKPVSKGGLCEIKNLQVLCKPCNIKKSNK